MRIKEFLGEKIELSEEEYNILLKRYDLRRVRKAKDIYGNPIFRIEQDCICNLRKMEDIDYYTPNCNECPLNINSETHGCNRIIEKIIGEYETPEFFYEMVEWSIEDNTEARENIRKIRKALKRMKRVK